MGNMSEIRVHMPNGRMLPLGVGMVLQNEERPSHWAIVNSQGHQFLVPGEAVVQLLPIQGQAQQEQQGSPEVPTEDHWDFPVQVAASGSQGQPSEAMLELVKAEKANAREAAGETQGGDEEARISLDDPESGVGVNHGG